MTSINVGGVEQFSLVDYPGKIAAVVFMQGCPWRCPFCYNSSLHEIGKNTNFIWENFYEFLKTRTRILDAVVFSGGEPLVQNGLEEAVLEVKALGYEAALHTGGYRPEHLAKVLPHFSWIGFDIKAPFVSEHYKKAVGGAEHLKNVLQSLDMILASGIGFECRTTCDPRILTIEDIYTIAKELKARGVKSYHLQKYRPIPGDNISTDWDCEQFFADKNLLEFLHGNFETFDIRK